MTMMMTTKTTTLTMMTMVTMERMTVGRLKLPPVDRFQGRAPHPHGIRSPHDPAWIATPSPAEGQFDGLRRNIRRTPRNHRQSPYLGPPPTQARGKGGPAHSGLGTGGAAGRGAA